MTDMRLGPKIFSTCLPRTFVENTGLFLAVFNHLQLDS